MSKLPTQEPLGLHLSCLEGQSVNPRRSSRLVPRSDEVDLPLDLDWNWSLPTFGAEARLCLVANRSRSKVGGEGGMGE